MSQSTFRVYHPNQLEADGLLNQARTIMAEWEKRGISIVDIAHLIRNERERAARIVEKTGKEYGALEASVACDEAAATIRYQGEESEL